MSESLDKLNWLLERTRAYGADAADGLYLHSIESSASQRLGKPEDIVRSESSVIGLRAMCGKQQAIVSSTDLSRTALEELAERAVSMARVTPEDKDNGFCNPESLATHIPDLDVFDSYEPDATWLAGQCKAAEEAALAVEGITNSEGAEAGHSQTQIDLAINSSDIQFARSYRSSMFSVSVSVLAGKDTSMERDYEFSSKRHHADLMPSEYIGKQAAKLALARLNPRKVTTCNAPVVLDPRVSKSLISMFTSAISGNAITRGASFLKDAMGKQIFNNGITIVDDPHILRGLNSKPFDAEGVRNGKNILLEHGVLKSWILDIRTANKLGLNTTGNASRSPASPPSPATTNTYMQNGRVSPKELLKDIKSGFYVTETFGMGVNIITGDYSQGASGFWIENGEIAYPVSEITIAGKLQDMFLSATPANDLTLRYATNAPTVRIDAMTIAGI
ncbi:MAG: TldD/PmbA family protein [Alphaproteobacteria bacterium]